MTKKNEYLLNKFNELKKEGYPLTVIRIKIDFENANWKEGR